jgi:predicted nucleic acid binding AN1-type Zn finger protein
VTNLHIPCSQKGCKNKEVVPVRCKVCLKNYCFSHRLQLDHTCNHATSGNHIKKENTNTASNKTIGLPIPNKSTKGPLNVANKPASPISLKTTAKGDARIPENKRIYLEVVYPSNTSIKPKMMFFNQEWSVGKALDVIADAGGVINTNNKPGPEKLCLFSLKTGEILPTSVPLSGLAPQISSFDAILLERVESNKMQIAV